MEEGKGGVTLDGQFAVSTTPTPNLLWKKMSVLSPTDLSRFPHSSFLLECGTICIPTLGTLFLQTAEYRML